MKVKIIKEVYHEGRIAEPGEVIDVDGNQLICLQQVGAVIKYEQAVDEKSGDVKDENKATEVNALVSKERKSKMKGPK